METVQNAQYTNAGDEGYCLSLIRFEIFQISPKDKSENTFI